MEIKIIKEKLQELKKLDKRLTVFGSQSHLYKSFPVSEFEIENFEKKYQFTLPENFRLFLIEIGYGAGPFYGILDLKETARHIEGWFLIDYLFAPLFAIEWTLYKIGVKEKNPFNQDVHPEKPFPMTQLNINRINERLKNDEWEFIGECGEIADYPADGSIYICHPGCHYQIVLATNGELTGSVWFIECDGVNSSWIPAEICENDNQVQNISFEQWYEDWLDLSIEKLTKK